MMLFMIKCTGKNQVSLSKGILGPDFAVHFGQRYLFYYRLLKVVDYKDPYVFSLIMGRGQYDHSTQ